MNTDEALRLLARGSRKVFNAYRKAHPQWVPDFAAQDLSRYDLIGDGTEPANLDNANLCGATLPSGPNLQYAGAAASLKGAIIDSWTTGAPLDQLHALGAQFATTDQVTKRREAAVTRVFISYAWANGGAVAAIDHWLRLKGLNTAIDKRDFFAGSRIRDEILRLMKASDVVLVFHSNDSKDKPWIEFERDLAADLQIAAERDKTTPPRVIYVVLDDAPLPGVMEDTRIAIMAKGKRFEFVCEEIYHHVLQLPRGEDGVDLSQWRDYVF